MRTNAFPFTRSLAAAALAACAITGVGASSALAAPAPAPATAAAAALAAPAPAPATAAAATATTAPTAPAAQLPGAIDPNRILADLSTTVDFTDDASAKAWMVDELGLTGLADKQVQGFSFVEMFGQRCPGGWQWKLLFNFAAVGTDGEVRDTGRKLSVTYAPDGARTAFVGLDGVMGNKVLAQSQPMSFTQATTLLDQWRQAQGWDTDVPLDSVVLRHVLDPYSGFVNPQMFFMVQGDARTVIAVDTITGEVTAMNPDDQ